MEGLSPATSGRGARIKGVHWLSLKLGKLSLHPFVRWCFEARGAECLLGGLHS